MILPLMSHWSCYFLNFLFKKQKWDYCALLFITIGEPKEKISMILIIYHNAIFFLLFRQNLDEVTASGSLEIPDLSGEIDQDTISRYLF